VIENPSSDAGINRALAGDSIPFEGPHAIAAIPGGPGGVEPGRGDGGVGGRGRCHVGGLRSLPATPIASERRRIRSTPMSPPKGTQSMYLSRGNAALSPFLAAPSRLGSAAGSSSGRRRRRPARRAPLPSSG
jgi:hypothetical protein